jgi:hypothetical protein
MITAAFVMQLSQIDSTTSSAKCNHVLNASAASCMDLWQYSVNWLRCLLYQMWLRSGLIVLKIQM